MRVAFAGTPPFAARALEAIARAGHPVVAVLTQPDRPAGRGLRLTPSAVAVAAQSLGLPVEKPASLRVPAALEGLRAARPDVMVVAAYGLILPRTVLDIPARGCLNIHASLLPRWRGAAPIHRAILAGDRATGVCIMQMEEGLDTGPVLLAREVPITSRDTTGVLTERLAALGAEAILEALAQLATLVPRSQDDAHATYAAKISKSEARIDWTRSCEDLDRQVRAFDPAPGAEAEVAGETFKVWSAEPLADARGVPGTVIRAEGDDLVIACGTGALQLKTLQKPGGRKMAAGEFLRGKVLRAATPPN